MSGLTHIDAEGRARMVDVSDKPETDREAVAEGFVRLAPETLALAVSGQGRKGDVRAVAEIAGVMGAKRTSDLIPLCHPLDISKAEVAVEVAGERLRVTARVRTSGRTGVEMEALTAVAVAALAVYDMIKAVDPAARIDDIRVLRKEGGKTGTWTGSP